MIWALSTLALAGCTTRTDQEIVPAGESETTLEVLLETTHADSAEAPTEENARTWDAHLARLAEDWGISNPPEVTVIRRVEPEESFALVLACMAENGFPVDDPHFTFPEEQYDTMLLVQYTCYARYPIDDIHFEPFSETQIEFIRDYWINEAIPCLADIGYEIEQPPSLPVVIQEWDTPDSWWPSGAIQKLNLPRNRFDEAFEKCPEWPNAAETRLH